ncbi:hypothetical protein [Bradyrhizobium sp. S69]|uniref:hypothetical protein n=1 Tax=Bradyrhizobium sp. S69 TaxID=1641856 RepID=UPI00131E651A|nr:hypothetical protein [Bradyrhizobium sp. S69]
MAKNSDQRAGGFEAENTGGVLSGLLAEEEHLDRRAMFRLATWGVVAVGAVVVAVFANQSGMKSRHDEIAALDLTRQSQQIQSVAKESQNETRRLASAIDTLNSDRDRVYSRLTTLEQGLESVTGAIAKQNAAPLPVAAAPAATPPASTAPAATPPASTPAATPQPVAQNTAPELAPVIAPVMTVAAAMPPEKPANERWRGESRKSSQAAIAPVAVATPTPSSAPSATSATPLMASKSMIGPPDPAAGKLIEPETAAKPVAAATPAPATPAPVALAPATPAPATAATTTPAPATSVAAMPPAAPTPTQATNPEPAPEITAAAPVADKPGADKDKKDGPDAAPAPAPQLAVKRTEFGVDVGGANSVSGLRALWRGLLKWRSNAALAGLQPIIVVKESNNGLGMQLRLVAGPLTDAAAAAKICAAMTINDRHCETTVYDGQRLALKAEDMPTTTESISAKPSAEKTSPEKTSDPAADKSASDKSSADKSSADKSSAKPGYRQSSRRHYSYSRRSAPVAETPPPPPPAQTSSLSWFHLRSQ